MVIVNVKELFVELKGKKKVIEDDKMFVYWVSKLLKDDDGVEVIVEKFCKKYKKGEMVMNDD